MPPKITLAVVVCVTLLAGPSCDRLTYVQEIRVPFRSVPSIEISDPVLLNEVEIGRVAKMEVDRDRVVVLADIRPGALPTNAVFVPALTSSQRRALRVSPLTYPPSEDGEPYLGVANPLELVVVISKDRLKGGTAKVGEWLVDLVAPNRSEPMK
jgi:hypothetical protein